MDRFRKNFLLPFNLLALLVTELFLGSLLLIDSAYASSRPSFNTLRPRASKAHSPFFDAPFVSTPNDLRAEDGGKRKSTEERWREVFVKAQTLYQFLDEGLIQRGGGVTRPIPNSGEVWEKVVRQLEKIQKTVRPYGEEQISLSIQEILKALYHYKYESGAPGGDMTSILIAAHSRVSVELLPRIKALAGIRRLEDIVREDLSKTEEIDRRRLPELPDWEKLEEEGQLQDAFIVVSLLAGKGSRFHVGEESPPKVVYPIGNEPLAWYTLQGIRDLRHEGFPTFTIGIVGGHPTPDGKSDRVMEKIGTGYVDRYVRQSVQRGSGHSAFFATYAIPKTYPGYVIVTSGDVVVPKEALKLLIREHRRSGAALSILTTDLENPQGKGRIIRRENGIIDRIMEQSDIDQVIEEGKTVTLADGKVLSGEELRAIKEINLGVYAARAKTFFAALREVENDKRFEEWYVTDVIAELRKQDQRIEGVRFLKASDIRKLSGANDISEFKNIVSEFLEELLFPDTVGRINEILTDAFGGLGEEAPLQALNTVLTAARVYQHLPPKDGTKTSDDIFPEVVSRAAKVSSDTIQFQAALERELQAAFHHAQDGGIREGFKRLVELGQTDIGDLSHWVRNRILTRKLRHRNVILHGRLTSGEITIGPEVDLSDFRGGEIAAGTQITGKSKIGPGTHLSGTIHNSVIAEGVQIYRGREIRDTAIEEGAVVEESKLINTTVGRNAYLENAQVSDYDLEENVRVIHASLSMDGESSFGNGVEIRTGPEKEGKWEVLAYDGLTWKEAKEVITRRADTAFLTGFREKVGRHVQEVASRGGRVGRGAVIDRTPVLKNVRVGPFAHIENAREIRDASILSTKQFPTHVNSGAIIRHAIVQEGSYVGEHSNVSHAILLKHSGAADGVKVEESWIAPHSIMRFGHVVASSIGPFVGKNHPSILIAVQWLEGRGNIGGQHTGSNHAGTGPTYVAWYPKFAFFGTNTDVLYPFRAATGLIVGASLTLSPEEIGPLPDEESVHPYEQKMTIPSQEIDFPFSVITTSANPRWNEILPGGGLYLLPYYFARLESNHRHIVRQKGTEDEIDTRVFTPEVIDEMIKARDRLTRPPVSGKPKGDDALYSERDYPGLGKSIMTEQSRQKAIKAYDLYILYHILKAFRNRLSQIFPHRPEEALFSSQNWRVLQGTLLLKTDDEAWEHARGILEERFGRKIHRWDKKFVLNLLKQLQMLENQYYSGILDHKMRERVRLMKMFDEEFDKIYIPLSEVDALQLLHRDFEMGTSENRRILDAVAALQRSADGGEKNNFLGLVALGANAFEGGTPDDQLPSLRRMLEPVAELIAEGKTFLLTHGNGPQVGEEAVRVELAKEAGEAPSMRLPYIVANTQGSMGSMIALTLRNLLKERGAEKRVVYLLTHVVVDPEDPAFQDPTKFIGKGYNRGDSLYLEQERGWTFKEYQNGIWRRVVYSPAPREILEEEMINGLLDKGTIVIAGGGGGIPVFRKGDGTLEVVDHVVIDKDRTSALLASNIGTHPFVILTKVPQVFLHFGTERQTPLSHLTLDKARQYLAEGHFPPGSMGPKIEAAIDYLDNFGSEVIITDGPHLREALEGRAGTRIGWPVAKDGGEKGITLQSLPLFDLLPHLPSATPSLHEIQTPAETALGNGV